VSGSDRVEGDVPGPDQKQRRRNPRGPKRTGAGPTRRDRSKARTRAALLRAAGQAITEGRLNAPILEITQAADVGLGSFYNHFESREALLQAALEQAVEEVGTLLDMLSAELDDPAERFAQSFRLFGRLHRVVPELMKIMTSPGTALLHADHGLVPRARRDLEAGVAAGRFTLCDPDLALALAVGSAMCLIELLSAHPERDAAAASDALAGAILRALGVDAGEAERICGTPLPDVDSHVGLALSSRSTEESP
jgi:AcrR family transcriptional regulator